MPTVDAPIKLFITCMIIFIALGVFVPIFIMAFGGSSTENSAVSDILNGNSGWAILINVLTSAFWTFGLPNWFNYFLFIPRVISWIAGYYIVFPTK